MFIMIDAFVERDKGDARRRRSGNSVPFDNDFAGIQHAGQPRRQCGRQPFRHRDDQNAAVCLGQQTALQDRTLGLQGRGEVQAAEQPVIRDIQRQPADGRTWRQQTAHKRDELFAIRTGPRPDAEATDRARIDSHDAGRERGI